ncbi:hypothetical protein [Streptomyces sp. NPDC126503]|uniref:hypothetical protein n=1 Tax=Streptomyces sp. NPDC126503 TaxID=3155315 RepID=UPI00331BC052
MPQALSWSWSVVPAPRVGRVVVVLVVVRMCQWWRALSWQGFWTEPRPPGTSASRNVDFTHLTRAGLLRPAVHVHSRFQPRSHAPAVPLYRYGDLQQLLTHPGIDWEEIRTTPKGRPSPLAYIPTASPSAGGGR